MKTTPATQSEITQVLAPLHDVFVRYGERLAEPDAVMPQEVDLRVHCEGNAEYAITTPKASFGIRQQVGRFVLPRCEATDVPDTKSLFIADMVTGRQSGLFTFVRGGDGVELARADMATTGLEPDEALEVTGMRSAVALCEALAEQVRMGAMHRGWRSRALQIDHDARLVVSEFEVFRSGRWGKGRGLSLYPRSTLANHILKLNMLDGETTDAEPLVEVEEFTDMRINGRGSEGHVLTEAQLGEVESYLGEVVARLGMRLG